MNSCPSPRPILSPGRLPPRRRSRDGRSSAPCATVSTLSGAGGTGSAAPARPANPRRAVGLALLLALLLPLAACLDGSDSAGGEAPREVFGQTAVLHRTTGPLALDGAVRQAPLKVTAGMLPVGDAAPPEGWFEGAGLERTARSSRATLRSRLTRAAGLHSIYHAGIHVRDLETGETVFARKADDPTLLASNTKIFTTAAALEVFGPGAFLETRLLARGHVDEDGVLHGDLAAVGAGDPTFSWRQSMDRDPLAAFRGWADGLEERGIREVDGHLYLDHGLFDAPLVHPDWEPRKRLRWYQAPVAAFAFHENVVTVLAEPAVRAGLPALVYLRPDLPTFEVDSTVLTTPSWRGNRLLVHRPPGDREISVAGGVYLRAGDIDMSITVEEPTEFFGDAVSTALAQEGVPVRGRRIPVQVLPGLAWEPVAVHRTTLLDVIEVTNHESQNLFAETLVKLVGAKRCGTGNWKRGTQAVMELARDLGVDTTGMALRDGSGLSRRNEASPSQVTAFLAGMARRPHRQSFLASLPTGGEDGTSLEDRLDEAPYPGNFWAKTGTLTGVSTLSGYARGPSGRVYAFSVLTRGGIWHGRQIQDAVVRALVNHG